jgi:hypothetical protein
MNKSSIFSLLLLSTPGMLGAVALSTASAETSRPRPASAQPISAGELAEIFGDKTWQWEAGGGRFFAEGRRFVAYSEEGDKPTVAEGRWRVTEGRLCLVARWKTKDANARNRTCFGHVRDRGTIFQRREPDGKWYVFRSYKPSPEDEISKLKSEDSVTPNVERLKQALGDSKAKGG